MNTAYFVPLVGITLMTIGVIGVGSAAWRSHRQNQRLDFIRSLGSEAELYAERHPPWSACRRPSSTGCSVLSAKGLRHNLSRLYPSQDIDRVHADLLKAGLTGSMRAEEYVAVQVGSVMLGIGIGLVALISGIVRSSWVSPSCSSSRCSEASYRVGGSAIASRRGVSRSPTTSRICSTS